MGAFECDGCGACCRTFAVFASAEDARREPRIAREARPVAPWRETADWAYYLYPLPFHDGCCFLDLDRRCTIYETRPGTCRAFPAGGEQCQEARARNGLPPLGPAGEDRGPRQPTVVNIDNFKSSCRTD